MTTLFDLKDQVAIITGSSRGIGKAIAERLAEHGARVVISSRKLAACEEVSQAINARYGEDRAIAIRASISSKDDLETLVSRTKESWGKIDILVCNAATNPYYGSMQGISDEQFRKVIDNNLLSNHWLIQLVAPEMRQRKHGSIIIVSSIGGLKGSPIIGAYHISKAADLALARNLGWEFGRDSVRVNCIAPGLVRTDFAKALWDDPENLQDWNSRAPMARPGEPDEIAGAAVFLASPASTFMTGQVVVIDGGMTVT